MQDDNDADVAAHIYPTWVSEGTCSTKCVDIRGEEEFCVATSACEHSTWRKAFDRHSKKVTELNGFEVPMSTSHCEVWGDQNRCDGTLCDADQECQSGCCGNFVSFTHDRCLPTLGDYCAGRDTTRKHLHRHHSENEIDEHLTKKFQERGQAEIEEGDKEEDQSQKEALAQNAKDRTGDGTYSEIV